MEQENWTDYIEQQAEQFDVSYFEAEALFEVLGPNEAYDGFIVALEDLERMKINQG